MAYFVRTMGWIDGNRTSLDPLAPKDEALRFIEFARVPLLMVSQSQWPARRMNGNGRCNLVDRLINADMDVLRNSRVKAEILKDRADDQINCSTRHYYLQCAKELEQSGSDT